MCSCTPKISEITRITGRSFLPSGWARYTGTVWPFTVRLTVPVSRPVVSVVITDWAAIGSVAAAKPALSFTRSFIAILRVGNRGLLSYQ
jgi:hypothetical protein